MSARLTALTIIQSTASTGSISFCCDTALAAATAAAGLDQPAALVSGRSHKEMRGFTVTVYCTDISKGMRRLAHSEDKLTDKWVLFLQSLTRTRSTMH